MKKQVFIKFIKRFEDLRLIFSLFPFPVGEGGNRGVGPRDNRGLEGYGVRERKGEEVGVLKGREARKTGKLPRKVTKKGA